MRSRVSSLLVIFLVIAVGILAYLLGRKNGSVTIDNVALNNAFVRQIAELSTVEVQGTSTIKRTNVQNDGSFTDQLRKMFLENTYHISIPYVAKYGVDLQGQKIQIEEDKKKIRITMPRPALVSYELRMDKADAMARKGLFQTENEEQYRQVQQKLYAESKSQMVNNVNYIKQAEDKIREVLQAYYTPMKYQLEINFIKN